MSKITLPGVRDLSISGPSNVGQYRLRLVCSVIVVAKYDFDSESHSELSVKKGDVLKLLDRPGNGWVLVKLVDRVATGLVPSLYVDIAVNDPQHPITLLWLHEKRTLPDSCCFVDMQVLNLLRANKPLTINNEPYPISATVQHFLSYQDRYWYRVDAVYSTGEVAYLCRYYEDFYKLHGLLMSAGNLPKLPEPIPSSRDLELVDLLSQRCKELDTYIRALVSDKRFQALPALVRWLQTSYEKRAGFKVEHALNEPNDTINDRILPDSVNLKRLQSTVQRLQSRLKQVPTTPQPRTNVETTPPATLARAKTTKNTYNHYHQALAMGTKRTQSTKESKQQATPTQTPDLSFASSMGSPVLQRTPSASPNVYKTPAAPSVPQRQMLKCTVKTQQDDCILLSINKHLIVDLEEFKRLVYRKIAYKNLYVRLESLEPYEDIDSAEDDLLGRIKGADAASLLVT